MRLWLLRLWLLAVASAAAAHPGPWSRRDRSSSSVNVHWLEETPASIHGATFGLPWPQGQYWLNSTDFTLAAASEGGQRASVPLQSWATGFWRDGSLKWTGHAVPALDSVADAYTVTANKKTETEKTEKTKTTSITVDDAADALSVDTGRIVVTFPKSGSSLVGSITTAAGHVVGQDGRLVLHTQSGVAEDVAARASTAIIHANFASRIDNVTVSEQTAVRTLVTVAGTHSSSSANDTETRSLLPFVVRFYLYAGSDALRIVHSVVFDQTPDADFLTGLGLRFTVPLTGEPLYDRHVRLGGVDGGLLHEAVQGITGLRRDPGEAVRLAQYDGRQTPNVSSWDTRVSSRLQWIPAWNDYRLSQLSPDGFTLQKRTRAGQSWLAIPGGTRSSGLAYLGGATVGGLAVVLRDFWKRFPTGVEVADAASDAGQLTLWLYSPEAAPLDLRPYHDGLGQDTFAKQLDGLQITYEDYEPGFATPYGIARTSELFVHAFDATPAADTLARLVAQDNAPPVLVADPQRIRATRALGSYWDLPGAASNGSKAAALEGHLDYLVGFYAGQVEDRRWYGFLDYGDVMHTYDGDRHTWRYDVGGYAWDNSELSPDLFFWQQFLRTGRADVYRLAEAHTRHTGEVDVYHAGDWKGLGTRHGVQHFSDSAKQVRIAQPQYRKAFFYLTGGDERVGELLSEAVDADQTYGVLDPQRKVRTDGWTPSPGEPVAFSLGTDWAGLAAGWLLEWERRGARWQEARAKLEGTAAGIANLTYGFVTGSGLYTIGSGTLGPPPADPNNTGLVAVSHLDAVFGLPEVVSELLEYWSDGDSSSDAGAPAGFRQAWLDYCYYYGASSAEQAARYGTKFSTRSLLQGHSRLTAFYAAESQTNETVALRAWQEFYGSDDGSDGLLANASWQSVRVDGSAVLAPVDEAAWLSTNAVAQYGLAAIQDLALVGDVLEASSYP